MVKKNLGGRPTVMTPEIVSKLEEAFSKAYTDEQACIYADISRTAFYDWIKLNPEFADRKELLKKRVDIKAKNSLVEAINVGDIPTAKWWLERKAKDEFSLRTEQTGADGAPLAPPKIIVEYVGVKDDKGD